WRPRHPCDGDSEGYVIEAAAVVKLMSNRPVGYIRARGIECAGAEQQGIELPPTVARGVGEDGKSSEKHEFFGQIGEVEIGAVNGFVDLHGLPGDHRVYIDENLPGEKKRKVKHADAFVALVFTEMRKHGKSGDHGHKMQK